MGILLSVKALRGALCIISNENLRRQSMGLYSRLWCGWEAFQASANGVHIVLHPDRSTKEHLFGRGEMRTISLRDGSCGPPKNQSAADKHNKKQITEAIEKGD